jgi:hypothetical protein
MDKMGQHTKMLTKTAMAKNDKSDMKFSKNMLSIKTPPPSKIHHAKATSPHRKK